MTGPLSVGQVETLVDLVWGAIDARGDYERALGGVPHGSAAEERADWDRQRSAAHEAALAADRADWDRRVAAAREAALAAERAAVKAIRALRRSS